MWTRSTTSAEPMKLGAELAGSLRPPAAASGDLAADPGELRLRAGVQRVDGLGVVHPLHADAGIQLGGMAQLFRHAGDAATGRSPTPTCSSTARCFVVFTMALGLLLAVLIDQRIRGENIYRTMFLYPLAVSFVVTGTVWGWLLNPSIGIQKLMHDLGWTSFRFEWLIDQRHGDLHGGHRRRLAGVRLRHGAVAGRAAFGGRRSAEGGADRWRRAGPHLSARGVSHHRADLRRRRW